MEKLKVVLHAGLELVAKLPVEIALSIASEMDLIRCDGKGLPLSKQRPASGL